MLINLLTLAGYFVLMLVIGGLFARFNRNLSDFVRGGARGSWWMVGMSTLMAGISAFTFTGNGSAVYAAGLTPLAIYAANLLGFVFAGLWLARWARQSRGYTLGDIIRDRFGPAVERTYVALNVMLAPFSSSVQLWSLALFVSAAFGLPLTTMIVISGAITLAYSTSGGMWAVMATDVVQGLLLYGITLLMAVLCVAELGGFDVLWTHYQALAAAGDYALVKPAGAFPQERFTWLWIVMAFVMQLVSQIHLGALGKYLAAKDGREASRAAWFGGALMLVGVAAWFLPPMTARFLYAAEVDAAGIADPATTAYVVAAHHVLPHGLLGVLIAAMFAATMSSIDMGLNNQTGVIVHNLLEPWRRSRGRPALSDRAALRLCRAISITLGLIIISVAVALSRQTRFPLFDAYMVINSIIVTPLTLPLVAGLVVRQMPGWAYFTMFLGGLVPSIATLVHERLTGVVWTVQDRSLWVVVGATLALLASLVFRHRRSVTDRERERAFFARIATPVDFAREIGDATMDVTQARIMGNITLVNGALLAVFLFVPNPPAARLAIAALALFVAACGAGLRWMAGRAAASRPVGQLGVDR